MFHVFDCQIAHGAAGLRRSMVRYAFLRRLAAAAARRHVTVLAFGIGEASVRLVLQGDATDVGHVVRGTKSGTSRALRGADTLLLWGETIQRSTTQAQLAQHVAWCHRVDDVTPPLANPWTSHRDLLGYRQAEFFDATALRAQVDAAQVHDLAGGGPLPLAGRMDHLAAGLDDLLRAAAAVLGVLPANRRCFRLFVHLARAQGWANHELARALMLTGRRIRQLAQDDEPLLPVAEAHMCDTRLLRVP